MILLGSLLFSTALSAYILISEYTIDPKPEAAPKTPPVVIEITDIPNTRQRPELPAPPKPYIPNSIPVEVEEDFLPDEITIEDTVLDIQAAPPSPAAVLVPDSGVSDVEEEIYEFFSVEEPPKRLTAVAPEYPEMAERAGIRGTVVLKVLINTEGTVDSIKVQDGPKVFHTASINAARKSTFQPARHNDKPVSCWIIMPFRFDFE